MRPRLRVPSAHWGVLLLVFAATLPLFGTIWTRGTNIVKVPKGGKEPLPNTAYVTRDWTVSVSSIEVRDDAGTSSDTATAVWTFLYKNTDSAPHYVSITVQCQDLARRDLLKFTSIATLGPNHKDDFPLEITSKVRAAEWKRTMFVRVTVDFLSTPTG